MVNTEIRLIIFFAAKDGEALYSQQKQDQESWLMIRARSLTGLDHELLIAKFRLQLKKVGKTTRQFRYDLSQIPYDYTVEVRNRFKGLDLIDCLKNYGWRFMTLCRRQGSRRYPRKINAKNKIAVWGGLTNSWEKKRSEKQRRKGKIYHVKSSKEELGEIRKPFSVISAKK